MDKKYYWLKLKEDFFQDVRMKKLRKVAGGDTYTIIYLKLQLLSIKNNGVLIYNGYLETIEEEFALAIDEDIQNVKMTLAFLFANKLIEEVEKNKFLMTETVKCIGSETASAERMRNHRKQENDKNQKLTYSNNENEYDLCKNASHCYTDVTNCYADVTSCYTEKREDIDKREDKEIDKKQEKKQKLEQMFEVFWGLYPKKINKRQCFTAFCNIKGLEKEFESIIKALKEDRSSEQWQRDNGKFIPYPLTWLHQERWKSTFEAPNGLPYYMREESRPEHKEDDEETKMLAMHLFNEKR